VAIVRAYFAHHQGMSLVAIGKALHGGVMQNRFHADPIVQATELLLQERTPSDVMVARPHVEDVVAAWEVRALVPPVERRFTTPHGPLPRTHLLSNGRYTTMVTAAGSGYSRWKDLAVTRWREDTALDAFGSYVYLRDRATGQDLVGRTPAARRRDRGLRGAVRRGPRADHAPRRRPDHHARGRGLGRGGRRGPAHHADQPRPQVARDRGHDLRRALPRAAERRRRASGVLGPVRPDRVHPRARRAPGDAADAAHEETPVWAACVLAIDGELLGPLEFETDRARFVGRGRDLRRPVALDEGRTLSNTVAACSTRCSRSAAR
jgi:cyclic beta-1,2-glucan synthetase